MEVDTIRLKPNQDLYLEIHNYVNEKGIEAGVLLSCVGSFKCARLRFANNSTYTSLEGYFEIVSVTGTVSKHGSHIHLALSDEGGKTWGGHLDSGCLVYTTAEVVIGVVRGISYQRELCHLSGYEELVVKKL